ncbi:MAG: hypothetical protein HRT72_09070, partial [Flavobacteriales bacterium]|nr:hypothetical protein [Flavobacteriales bacterium]
NKWADNLQVSLDSEQSKIREAKPENRAGIKKRIVMLESLVVKKRNMANNLLGLDEMSEPVAEVIEEAPIASKGTDNTGIEELAIEGASKTAGSQNAIEGSEAIGSDSLTDREREAAQALGIIVPAEDVAQIEEETEPVKVAADVDTEEIAEVVIESEVGTDIESDNEPVEESGLAINETPISVTEDVSVEVEGTEPVANNSTNEPSGNDEIVVEGSTEVTEGSLANKSLELGMVSNTLLPAISVDEKIDVVDEDLKVDNYHEFRINAELEAKKIKEQIALTDDLERKREFIAQLEDIVVNMNKEQQIVENSYDRIYEQDKRDEIERLVPTIHSEKARTIYLEASNSYRLARTLRMEAKLLKENARVAPDILGMDMIEEANGISKMADSIATTASISYTRANSIEDNHMTVKVGEKLQSEVAKVKYAKAASVAKQARLDYTISMSVVTKAKAMPDGEKKDKALEEGNVMLKAANNKLASVDGLYEEAVREENLGDDLITLANPIPVESEIATEVAVEANVELAKTENIVSEEVITEENQTDENIVANSIEDTDVVAEVIPSKEPAIDLNNETSVIEEEVTEPIEDTNLEETSLASANTIDVEGIPQIDVTGDGDIDDEIVAQYQGSLNEDDLRQVFTSPGYKDYKSIMEQLLALKKQADGLETEATQLDKDAEAKEAESEGLKSTASTEGDEDRKQRMLARADQLDADAVVLRQNAISAREARRSFEIEFPNQVSRAKNALGIVLDEAQRLKAGGALADNGNIDVA